MAARFKEVFETEAELIAEGRGVFDVRVDDELIYSKHQTGTFPDEDQLLAALQASYST